MKITNNQIGIIAFCILLALVIASAIQTNKVIEQYNDLADKYNNECILSYGFAQNTPPLSAEYNLAEGLNLTNTNIK